MKSAGRPFLYLLILLAGSGCAAPAVDPDPTVVIKPFEKPLEGDSTLTALGELQIADTLDHAKSLFPAPSGADISTQPELTLPGESYYGWATDRQVFDAFSSDGRLTTISLLKKGLTESERQTEIDRELERFDEPTENAEGKTAAAYLWRDGDYARIVVDFFGGAQKGVLKVAGIASSLEARGFPISHLSDLVAAFDEHGVQ